MDAWKKFGILCLFAEYKKIFAAQMHAYYYFWLAVYEFDTVQVIFYKS